MKLFRQIMALPDPLASWSDAIDGLHAVVLLSALVGCAVIFTYTAYALIFYRSKAPFPLTPRVVGSRAASAAVFGGLLGLFLLWWGLGYRTFTRTQSPPEGALDIEVIAKQWMWKFVYPDGTSSLGALVVPRDQPVRLVMTSRDVIHSFFVPALRVKRDVVPGTVTTLWFVAREPGTWPVFCAEFCGLDHSVMRASLVVLEPEAWAAWAASRGPLYAGAPGEPAVDLAQQGRRIAAQRGCLRCHTVDGTPDLGPTWVGVYGGPVQLADGRTVQADDAYLTRSMMDPLADVVAGYPPLMPSYRGQLSVEDTGALVAYLRALGSGPDRGQRP